MQWSFDACNDVEEIKESEVTTTTTTTRSTRTHDNGHAGIQCVDYNEHDTDNHQCHWCYEKVDSEEFINGDWLEASFSVLMETVRNDGEGMFHIGITGKAGKNAKVGWYEIGVYSTSFFVRRVDKTNRWGEVYNQRFEFGHSTKGTRSEIWIRINHWTGKFQIGHGRCVGKEKTILMDWTDRNPLAVDRFEVQGYVST
jgi:hypothetical protein